MFGCDWLRLGSHPASLWGFECPAHTGYDFVCQLYGMEFDVYRKEVAADPANGAFCLKPVLVAASLTLWDLFVALWLNAPWKEWVKSDQRWEEVSKTMGVEAMK